MRHFARSLFLCLLAPLFGSGAALADLVISDIQAVDLGTLPGGANSSAADINAAGHVAGSSETLSGETHAFLLVGALMTDLGVLPGGDRSVANGLNDVGQVVGSARNAAGVDHGFEWSGGVLRDLGAFPPQDPIGSMSRANAINDAGLIAGSVDLAGVVWDLFGIPNFPPFPPNVRVTDPGPFSPAIAFDVNDAGQVAGTLLPGGTAFRWQAGTLELLVPLQQGIENDGLGINGLGHVVGRGLLAPPVQFHAVLWPDPSSVIDLGTLGGVNSVANAINDAGLVVGSSETPSGETLAFVWRADLGMHSLGTLGGANSEAFAVNAAGQIVGESETATGETRATLWTVTIATEIEIDIKPGSDVNPVNLRSRGKLPVAVLTTPELDAASLDPESITLGDRLGIDTPVARKNNGTLQTALEDVDGDGDADRMLHFETQELVANGDLTPSTSELFLRGTSSAIGPILGSDVVSVK